MRIKYKMVAVTLLVACSANAGMIGDPVTGILHTAAAGSWNSGAATVGPGIEFTRNFSPVALLTLDLAAASFTLTYTDIQPANGFNAGLDGFEFTDLDQTFTGVSLVAGNTFPNGTFTSASVSANTIHIFTNEVILTDGATWTATWNVNFAPNSTPEPGTFALLGLSLAVLAARRWRRRQANAPQF